MSKQIRVLSEFAQSDGSFIVTAVFWLTSSSDAIAPIPNFASADPNIDNATWIACQEGTLVEQVFTSGAYTAGTILSAVESDLQSNYTAAQSALTSANPPLLLNGLTYDGTSWATLSEPSFFLRVPPTIPFAWAAAMGRLNGVTVSRAAGYVATSAASNTAVRATTYTAPGSNGQRSLSSSSANDTAAGTGARTVVVTFLDAAFAVHQETVTLNGTTPVNMVATNLAYVESIVVATVGSGGINAGVISLFSSTAGGGSAVGSIAIGDQQTWWCHHYVPAGVTMYVLNVSVGATVVGGSTNMIHLAGLGIAGAPTSQIGSNIVHGAAGYSEHKFDAPLAVSGPDLVYVNDVPLAATASKVFANFEYVQF